QRRMCRLLHVKKRSRSGGLDRVPEPWKFVVGGPLLGITEHGIGARDVSHARLRLRISIRVGMVKPHERAIRRADDGILRPRHHSQGVIMAHGCTVLTREGLFPSVHTNTIAYAIPGKSGESGLSARLSSHGPSFGAG